MEKLAACLVPPAAHVKMSVRLSGDAAALGQSMSPFASAQIASASKTFGVKLEKVVVAGKADDTELH